MRQALSIATEGGAGCLGLPDIGRLEPGCRADLAIWPGDDVQDIADPIAALVLGPRRSVRHLLVDGEFVVQDGVLTGLDLAAARAALARRSRRRWD